MNQQMKEHTTAVHEAGHAVMALYLGCENVAASVRPDKLFPCSKKIQFVSSSRSEIEEAVRIALSGYIAETVVFEGKTNSHRSLTDVWSAASIAKSLFSNFGPAKVPHFNTGMFPMIKDREVRAYIESALYDCADVLWPFKGAIQNVADALLKRAELSPKELNSVFECHKFPRPKDCRQSVNH